MLLVLQSRRDSEVGVGTRGGQVKKKATGNTLLAGWNGYSYGAMAEEVAYEQCHLHSGTQRVRNRKLSFLIIH